MKDYKIRFLDGTILVIKGAIVREAMGVYTFVDNANKQHIVPIRNLFYIEEV